MFSCTIYVAFMGCFADQRVYSVLVTCTLGTVLFTGTNFSVLRNETLFANLSNSKN